MIRFFFLLPAAIFLVGVASGVLLGWVLLLDHHWAAYAWAIRASGAVGLLGDVAAAAALVRFGILRWRQRRTVTT